jgi:hypothetical protein
MIQEGGFMLISRPTKYGSGITLYGDYLDLQNLYETISYLSTGGPLTPYQEEFLLHLAYDVRDAFQGDRKEEYFGFDEHSKVRYFGVDVLWPIFLVQVGALRWSAGYHETDSEYQANLYRLESCAEYALMKNDEKTGLKCMEWLKSFPGFWDSLLVEFISYCSKRFIMETKQGKSRFKKLPEYLYMISPISDECKAFHDEMEKLAKQQGCKPEELSNTEEFPEFKW